MTLTKTHQLAGRRRLVAGGGPLAGPQVLATPEQVKQDLFFYWTIELYNGGTWESWQPFDGLFEEALEYAADHAPINRDARVVPRKCK